MTSENIVRDFLTDYNLAKLEVEKVISGKYDVSLEVIGLDEPIHNYEDFRSVFSSGDVIAASNKRVYLKLEQSRDRWINSQGLQISDKDLFLELVLASFYGHKIKLAHISAQSF